MLQAELTGWVHDLIEEDAEASLFQPVGQEVLTAEGIFVDVGLEEHTVDSDGRLAIRPHPLICHNMHEEAPTATGDRVVFDDLYPHGGLAIDCEQRDGDWHEVPVLLEELRPEAILSDGQVQNGIFDVSVAIVVCEGPVES